MLAKKKAVKRAEIKMLVDNCDMVPVQKLRLWLDNPRYNDEAVPKLAKIFRIHGVRTPVVVCRKNNVIYKGNTSYKAMKSLGMLMIPVNYQDFKSEAEAKAYGIADNKSGEYSDWDEDVLLNIMQSEEMQDKGSDTGFRETELIRMLEKQNKNIIGTGLEGNSDMLPKLTLIYHPTIGESLKHFLEKTVVRKFGDKILIRG